MSWVSRSSYLVTHQTPPRPVPLPSGHPGRPTHRMGLRQLEEGAMRQATSSLLRRHTRGTSTSSPVTVLRLVAAVERPPRAKPLPKGMVTSSRILDTGKNKYNINVTKDWFLHPDWNDPLSLSVIQHCVVLMDSQECSWEGRCPALVRGGQRRREWWLLGRQR